YQEINIVDDSQDSVSNDEETEVEKVADSFDDNSVDGLEDIVKDPTEDKDEEKALDNSSKAKNGKCKQSLNEVNSAYAQSSKEQNSSDLSCPPGFEHLKRGSTSRCSTSFARYRKKDIKGIFIIDELTRIIEVGGSLGFDVKGCRKSLNKMVNGIGAHIVNK
ncbi:hypothetical protein Tco_1542362, partial [Tanacetum coccineum]